MTRRVEDFGKFMRDHVNLNPSRYERLKRSDKAVSEYLSQNLVGFKRTERQGSYALGTTIRPVKDTDGYDVTASSTWNTTGPRRRRTTLTTCTGA